MEITIKALSPVLTADFLDYFDNAAFCDHAEWSGCYCVEPHLCDKVYDELNKGRQSKCRGWAVDLIASGKLRGYLAYADGKAVGWCNANDKRNFEKLTAQPEFWDETDKTAKIKSIMCYSVAPDMRGCGIATALLDCVCADAAAEGCDYVEAYTFRGEFDAFDCFSGPSSMYEKQGFEVYRTWKHLDIVRKKL
jgi:Acetyltransferases